MRSRIDVINGLPISRGSKLDLTLVYAGVKPCTSLKMYDYHNLENGVYRLTIDTIMTVLIGLNQIGCPFLYKPTEIIDRVMTVDGQRVTQPSIEVFDPYIAKDHVWLDRILQAKDDEELGLCYGFPESSIEAYIGKRERLPPEFQIPQEYDVANKFSQFIMSSDNWKEEIKTSEAWGNVVKELNPWLFDTMINPDNYGIVTLRSVVAIM